MTSDAVHFYWRRGCVFCTRLRRGLDKAGIETVDHDIWDDPDAAATVRYYANGNETVPTIVVGDVGMVNPTWRQVAEYLGQAAPHLLPQGDGEPPGDEASRPGLVGRLLGG